MNKQKKHDITWSTITLLMGVGLLLVPYWWIMGGIVILLASIDLIETIKKDYK